MENQKSYYIVTFGFNGDDGYAVVKSKPILASSGDEAEQILLDQFESFEGFSCDIIGVEKQSSKTAMYGGYYAKGGKMENMYKIVDIDGDTVKSNLNEQEVIDFADSLGYYEAQDNEEEPIYDIDSAISLIEMEGDYTVVKMSEYGGSVYAKGGKLAKFDAYEVAGELAELSDGVWDKLGITDGGMLYNDESLQAKVNEEYAKAGIDEIFKALSTVNRKKVAEALTDENNHNLRNYLALRGYLGNAEKRSYTKLFKESGKFKIVLNPTIFGVKPLVSEISTYVPHSKVLSITIKKGDKEYKLSGSDILDGVYVKDGEFKRGGVMKTLRRWWKKLNGTWYYNEGAGWRRDRKFQNKSEKYEKDGRKTYKQVTRGYVDDMPYEYAKGGMSEKMFFGDASIEWRDRNGEEKSEKFRKYIKAKNKGEAYRFFLKFIEDETNQFDENLVKNYIEVYEVETQDEIENAIYMGYLSDKNYYAKGGMVDLFEDFEKMPKNVREIVERYQDEFMGDMDYKDTQNMLNELEAVGYTFDYYLDNEPYGLRPIGTPLSALRGYEDEEYAKGGDVAVPEKIDYSSMFASIPRSTDNEKVV